MALTLNVRRWRLPFRVGTTSYILADDLLPNAGFLAAHVQDMQLVLFEVPGGPSNLPSTADVAALAALGQGRDLTYTVHLLHDLRLRDESGAPALALAKAQQVIELTRPLGPQAWVCHLDGRSVRAGAEAAALAIWEVETTAALRQVCAWAGEPERVAVENLEGYAPEFVAPVAVATEAGRCVDVGHLWLDGVDPLPHLAAALPRLRVVHLHGLAAGRDHASLAHMPPAQVDGVLRLLLAARFAGVLTLEVFGEEDFWSSLDALAASVTRVR
jgi:sugar phosphate isomerase/epimerase